jgi:hypothetical protein
MESEFPSRDFESDCGPVAVEDFTKDYHDAVRLVYESVRRRSARGQVFVSLERRLGHIATPVGMNSRLFRLGLSCSAFAALAREGR